MSVVSIYLMVPSFKAPISGHSNTFTDFRQG